MNWRFNSAFDKAHFHGVNFEPMLFVSAYSSTFDYSGNSDAFFKVITEEDLCGRFLMQKKIQFM